MNPYKTYKVRIRPKEGGDIVGYDADAYEFTLFPGNIAHKTWAIEKTFIGIGRIVNERGEPIVHERIKGLRDYTITEEDGTFQAEMNGFETATIKNKNRDCTVLFTKLTETPSHFNDYGDIVCKAGAVASDAPVAVATPVATVNTVATPIGTPVATPIVTPAAVATIEVVMPE